MIQSYNQFSSNAIIHTKLLIAWYMHITSRPDYFTLALFNLNRSLRETSVSMKSKTHSNHNPLLFCCLILFSQNINVTKAPLKIIHGIDTSKWYHISHFCRSLMYRFMST